jgi:hypothetical protein
VSTILVNTGPTTITKTWYVDGTPTDVGDVTIGVTDANGTEVVAAGAATTNNADGTYDYALPIQTDLTILKVEWTDDSSGEVLTDTVEVVGSYLFSIAEARAYNIVGGQTPLSSTSSYPTSKLVEWRDQIAQMFEQRTFRSFTKRYARIELAGDGSTVLYLGDGFATTDWGDRAGGVGRFLDIRRIISVTVNGTAVSLSNVKLVNNGMLRRINGSWTSATSTDPLNIVIEYEYGMENYEARENGLRLLAANAIPSDVSSRATSFSDEDGTFRLTTLPVQVEEFLRSYSGRTFV